MIAATVDLQDEVERPAEMPLAQRCRRSALNSESGSSFSRWSSPSSFPTRRCLWINGSSNLYVPFDVTCTVLFAFPTLNRSRRSDHRTSSGGG